MRTGFIVSATLFLLISVYGCARFAREKGTETISGFQQPKIQIVTAEAVSSPQAVKSFGSLAPISRIDITSSVEGTVCETAVAEGSRVEKGDLLMRLENIQLRIREKQARAAVESQQAAYALAEAAYWEGKLQVEARLLSLQQLEQELAQRKAELDGLEIEMANKSRLFELGGISEELYRKAKLSYRSAVTDVENLELDVAIKQIGFREEDVRSRGLALPAGETERADIFQEINNLTLKAELDAAEAALGSARAELESLELLLAELTVNAPSAGIAGPVYAEQGERTAVGDELMYIFPDDRLHIIFHLQEEAAGYVRQGQKIEAVLPALSGQKRRTAGPASKSAEKEGAGSEVRRGVVDIVSPIVDPDSGNIVIKGVLDNEDGRLKPGMFARVTLVYGPPRELIVLPENCFVSRKDRQGLVFTVLNGRVFPAVVRTGENRDGQVEILEGLKPGDTVAVSPPPGLKEGEEIDVIE